MKINPFRGIATALHIPLYIKPGIEDTYYYSLKIKQYSNITHLSPESTA